MRIHKNIQHKQQRRWYTKPSSENSETQNGTTQFLMEIHDLSLVISWSLCLLVYNKGQIVNKVSENYLIKVNFIVITNAQGSNTCIMKISGG